MTAVTLKGISKQFGRVSGVSGVNVEIGSGEFFTLLGPSGCGKTTTLRMIAGFYYPSEGRILFGEQDVTSLPPNKRNTGMVFQNYALFPHMTVFENIAFGLQTRKEPKVIIRDKVERALAQVHLETYGTRRIDQLSGGQQQRVALARALVIQPDLLLLDEPLSNLDAKLREETRYEIKRLQLELGVTTLYVTHDQAEAMSMSDRIMVMNGGTVQQIGTPQEIYNEPVNRFVSTFIGETNLWEGTVERIEGDDVYVRVSSAIVLLASATRKSPSCQLQVGAKLAATFRPESVQEVGTPQYDQAGAGSLVTGFIQVSEFTGISTQYLTFADSLPLRAMFVGVNHLLRERGDKVSFCIPKDSVYLLE
ncbi:ABC transporter ATP-binding protein [Paenibacillus sp. N1-5-1-14]|uniref:ABC transporter ATP-binding protein n=1 Tax=Paenibacillus radicibacter TaxID=2972488 RepID=UPI0021590EC1|nr:ABC transporter ATP-binding protein [Paenibacillus radicibacter]MCR8643504.1 ABC transporter ATP-binding protein [Paenibacillus radicibacter]